MLERYNYLASPNIEVNTVLRALKMELVTFPASRIENSFLTLHVSDPVSIQQKLLDIPQLLVPMVNVFDSVI